MRKKRMIIWGSLLCGVVALVALTRKTENTGLWCDGSLSCSSIKGLCSKCGFKR